MIQCVFSDSETSHLDLPTISRHWYDSNVDSFRGEKSRSDSNSSTNVLAFILNAAKVNGPRRVDKYLDSNKTKNIDKDEMCRLGETSGDMDDMDRG